MANKAFLMPGQGSQYVGMTEKLKQFPSAMKIIEEANDILGFDIAGLMENGPADELKQTENTQPALVATSCAWLKVINDKGTKCDMADHIHVSKSACRPRRKSRGPVLCPAVSCGGLPMLDTSGW